MSESGIAKFERLATDAIGRDDTREQSRRKQIEMMGEKLTIKRSDIVRELEAIVHTRLFGPGPWLIDREAGAALEKRILEMGLRDEEKRRDATDVSQSLTNSPQFAGISAGSNAGMCGLCRQLRSR